MKQIIFKDSLYSPVTALLHWAPKYQDKKYLFLDYLAGLMGAISFEQSFSARHKVTLYNKKLSLQESKPTLLELQHTMFYLLMEYRQ